MIQGLYIDRKKNGLRENFLVDSVNSTNDKVIFVREPKSEGLMDTNFTSTKDKHASQFEQLKREKSF